MEKVFVAIGGNIGDRIAIFNMALQEISCIKLVHNLQRSGFYQTSPVSPIPQEDYLNAVCSFDTTLEPKELFKELQKIEVKLGKVPKIKDAPRVIDLDLLFYGTKIYRDSEFEIPHPRWMQRKFVLIPLLDLVEELVVPNLSVPEGKSLVNIRKMIELIPYSNNEVIQKVFI